MRVRAHGKKKDLKNVKDTSKRILLIDTAWRLEHEAKLHLPTVQLMEFIKAHRA